MGQEPVSGEEGDGAEMSETETTEEGIRISPVFGSMRHQIGFGRRIPGPHLSRSKNLLRIRPRAGRE